jgi:hypothetical protein
MQTYADAYRRMLTHIQNVVCEYTSAHVSIRQHTLAYVSIRHAGVSICTSVKASKMSTLRWGLAVRPILSIVLTKSARSWSHCPCFSHSTCQHTSAHVSTRQHTSAYVSIRQHTAGTCFSRSRSRALSFAAAAACVCA